MRFPLSCSILCAEANQRLSRTQKAVCVLNGTTSASCTFTDMQETPSHYAVVTQGFEGEDFSLVPVTITARTITRPLDTIVTMSGSSPSRPTSYSASATSSGLTSRTSSVKSSVSGDQGTMSIMTTTSHASTPSSFSSSTRSTGGAPMATGEVAIMAGGAAMALLVAIL